MLNFFKEKLNKMRDTKGFTLVELLVVMTIIGIIIALAIGGFGIAQRMARDVSRDNTVRDIQLQLQSYYAKYKRFPVDTNVTITSDVVTLKGVDNNTTTFTIKSSQPGLSVGVAGCTTAATSAAWTIYYKTDATGQSFTLYACKESGQGDNVGELAP